MQQPELKPGDRRTIEVTIKRVANYRLREEPAVYVCNIPGYREDFYIPAELLAEKVENNLN